MKNRLFLLQLLFFFSLTFVAAQSPEIIFEATFENTLNTTDGESPAIAQGLSFVKGVAGQGILMESGDILQYPTQNNISAAGGSLSVWVRPQWNPGDTLYRLVVFGTDPGNFEMHVDESTALVFVINIAQAEGKPIRGAFGSAAQWKAGNWYALTFTWDANQLRVFVNGTLEAETEVGYDIPLVNDTNFNLGSLNGEAAFRGTIDELRIYDGPLTAVEVQEHYQEYLDQLPPANAITVTDIFGRNVTEMGISLVDWEGPVRNPALKYFLQGNQNLEYPLSLRLSSSEERASFNLPSLISKNGPAKSMQIAAAGDLASFLFSVYMDENFENETFDLILEYPLDGILSRQIIPVLVIDQDWERPLNYPVIVDFSEAVSALMLDPNSQSVIQQAAEDWLYYVDGEGIDSIGVGESYLEVGGQDHFFEEKRVTNPVAYQGYYLYAYGNNNEQGPCICSTGFPNRDLLQTKNGEMVPIPRIGGLHLNIFGQAFETPPTGWEVLSPYENWTQEGLIGTDMYTLAKHEIGHAMVFEEIPLYKEAQERLGFVSPALSEYYQDTIVPLLPWSTAHLFGLLDPASQSTPYGGGVDEEVMPGGREMLTKLDILIMESVGYPLRDNEVTRALSLTTETPLQGVINQTFEEALVARGGIPVYHFEIVQGELPPGLSLNAATGKIVGIPEAIGDYPLTFSVRDYTEGKSGVLLEVVIQIIKEGSSLAELISFDIPGQIGETVINDTAKTVLVVIPAEMDISNLQPSIVISAGAIISPGNGEPQNFTEPVSYIITSENGAFQNTWIVTVMPEASTAVKEISVREFSLYPNPLQKRVKLEFQLVKRMHTTIGIYQLNGKWCKSHQLGNIQQWNQWLDLSDLKPGSYILQIVGDGETLVAKKLMVF